MQKAEVLRELRTMGTAQNRKIYARHGVRGDLLGVSYANLGRLRKKIGIDDVLATALWESQIHDARVLATMIADPAATRAARLDAWVRDLDNYVLTDAFSSLASKTSLAKKRAERWTASRSEWIGAAGWQVVAHLALAGGIISEQEQLGYLRTIEQQIRRGQNRVRHAMNGALIALGLSSPQMERAAIAAARRIGVVNVDHGQTGCRTPDAEAYILKTKQRRRKKS